ncbi:MAG: shikimate dehydrogenase [Marinirhabdus sp.]|nr:shikimate dehydrogenase [Marinirhabdus sp.]
MAKYGLLGKNISYSFSRTFFSNKFEKENKQHTYDNFEIACIEDFETLLTAHPDIKGLNVTIPYKEAIIPYLYKLDKESKEIGAVNTIKFRKDGKLVGYNTDHYGFAKSLIPYLPIHEKTALILGTGGASKAIKYVLDAMEFNYLQVSRTTSKEHITYRDVTKEIIDNHFLIINCTPLGTFPNVHETPKIPYQHLGKHHVLYDLIYNPRDTEFMKLGRAKGARVTNGLKMLEYQAEKSWSIWRK